MGGLQPHLAARARLLVACLVSPMGILCCRHGLAPVGYSPRQ